MVGWLDLCALPGPADAITSPPVANERCAIFRDDPERHHREPAELAGGLDYTTAGAAVAEPIVAWGRMGLCGNCQISRCDPDDPP